MTPISDCTPPWATRKPVFTSSMISSTPWRSQSSRASCTNSGRAEIAQQLPWIGSISMAAMLVAVAAEEVLEPLLVVHRRQVRERAEGLRDALE